MSERFNDESLAGAAAFFNSPAPTLTSSAGVKAIFDAEGGTLGTVSRFVGQLPEQASAEQKRAFAELYQRQRHYLERAVELAAFWIDRRFAQDPRARGQASSWLEPLKNMPGPFYSLEGFKSQHFQKQQRGLDLAASLQLLVAEWIGEDARIAELNEFLSGVGSAIRQQLGTGNRSVDTYHVVLNYQPVRDAAGNWQLLSSADIYLLSLTEHDKDLYSSCKSAALYPFEFNCQKSSLRFNASALNDPSLPMWDQVLDRSGGVRLDQQRFFYEKTVQVRS